METQLQSSPSSSSSANNNNNNNYHIFLSFRGTDTRKNFTDHLYTAFTNSGFHTFRDNNNIHLGHSIRPQLHDAIRQSSISVIVFSKHYASSKWCLDELLMILQRKRLDDRYCIFPVFYDVMPTDVGNPKGGFELEKTGGHSEEIIAEWKDALKQVSKLTGKVLQDESNGHEAVFIQTIVEEVGIILKRTVLAVPSYTVGVESRVKDIDLWLKDPAGVGVGVISGMRGIGKTTIAKVAYNLNFADFEASSFLANIREASERQDGLVRLQSQFLSDVSKGKKQKIYYTDVGIVKIQAAMCRKRILLILDDVDQIEHVDTLIGSWGSLHKGSKIIITTSRERLPSHQTYKTFGVKPLNNHESLKLFCRHAFSQECPVEGYSDHSERVVRHCEGLPLALEVIGSSLYGRNSEFWASALEKLLAISDERICKTLEVSFKSLHDDYDKRLFLVIASSYVGQDKDDAVKKLEKNDFYSKVGMQNLMDRSLVSIDKDNKIVMHLLVRDMARAIIRQETADGPAKHSFYNPTEAISETLTTEGSLLRENVRCGKRKHLDEHEDESASSVIGDRPSLLKRLRLGFSSLFEPATKLFTR